MSEMGRKLPFAVILTELQEWHLSRPKAEGPLSARKRQPGWPVANGASYGRAG